MCPIVEWSRYLLFYRVIMPQNNVNNTLTIVNHRNPFTGMFDGMYTPVANGVNFIGNVGHGNVLTITDSLGRFQNRNNIKPLFVNLGDTVNGSSLGRITSSHINNNLTVDASVKAGSLSSSFKWDIKVHGDGGLIGTAITTQDQSKPLIQYIERRYGFDFDDPDIQNNGYYFSSPPWQNNNVFTITIDGRTYTHTNDGSPATINNADVVESNLTAQINADPLCKCTVTSDGTFGFRLVKKVPTEFFTVTYNQHITQNFNNKQARSYAWNNSGNNDTILITSSKTGGGHSYMENTDGNASSPYYNAKPEENSWMNEELILKNSSAPAVSDGYYRHYKKGELLNPTASFVTHDVGEQPLGRCYLNQLSNGPYGYWTTELYMHLGYQCWDDEYLGIYLADSATIVPGSTTIVRQPQVTWTINSVSFQQIHSLVDPHGAHVFLRTSETQFIHMGQLPS